MRILCLTENFPPEMNAAATRVYERACYWVRWGHEVTVVTQAPNFPVGELFEGYENRWYQTEERDGIRVVRVKTYITPNAGTFRRTLDFLSFMTTGAVAGWIQRDFDVVTATSPQFFSAVAGWLVGLVRMRPFVFELGDLWPASITGMGAMKPNLFLRAMERLELFLYRRAAAVAALTRSFKSDLLRRGIPEKKVAVVINGVDLPRYGPRPKDAGLLAAHGLAGRFVIGYLGTHGMAHDLGNVLRAAEGLREREDVLFLFVGAGACRDALVQEAEALQLPNVRFVPPQPKESMPAWWSVCDVALIHLKQVPVFETVIPSKIFEAMGMGLPILYAGPSGEASAIIEKERAGLCVGGGDPKALAAAAARLAEDAPLRQALATASHEAAPRYSRERQARDMLAVLAAAAEDRDLPHAVR